MYHHKSEKNNWKSIVCDVPSIGAKCGRENCVDDAGNEKWMMLEMKNTELLLLLGNKHELYSAFLDHLMRYKEMYDDYS